MMSVKKFEIYKRNIIFALNFRVTKDDFLQRGLFNYVTTCRHVG
jgi:hypothetical protein